MTPQQARLFAAALIASAEQAEAQGRDLVETDLSHFSSLDDAARAELQAAIEKKGS